MRALTPYLLRAAVYRLGSGFLLSHLGAQRHRRHVLKIGWPPQLYRSDCNGSRGWTPFQSRTVLPSSSEVACCAYSRAVRAVEHAGFPRGAVIALPISSTV